MSAIVSRAGAKPSSVMTVAPDPSVHCMLANLFIFNTPHGRGRLEAPLCAALACVHTLKNRLMAVLKSTTVCIFTLSLPMTHHTVNRSTITQVCQFLLFLILMLPVTRMLYQ